MTIKAFKESSKGSALITVLIAMLFIGIISSIVIAIAHSNLENSRTSMNSTDNFYSGEKILDKFVSNINDKAEEAMVEVYEKWLQIYSTVDSSQLETEYFRLFNDAFKKKIENYIQVSGGPTPTGDIKDLLYGDTNTGGLNIHDLQYDDSTTPPTITGISIKSVDDKGNVVTINTDLVLSVHLPTMEASISKGDTNIENYILIADGQINFDQGKQILVGNIYGGGKDFSKNEYKDRPGILLGELHNDTVELNSDRIITRTVINTKYGTLKIAGRSYPKYSTDYANVWTNNILMDGSTSSTIEIYGSCNVADDLSIDSADSTFKLLGDSSEYYGYVFNTSSVADYDRKPEGSSSIVINGKGVTLDLSLAKKVLLAGKNYVRVPSNWNFKNVSFTENTNPDGTFMLGESLSCRWLQSAYLLPGECVVGVKHNPMTVTEYNSIISKTAYNALSDTEKIGKSYVDIKETSNKSIDLSEYLKTSDPYFAHHVQYGSNASDQLVYLYMRFESPAKAAKYSQAYSRDDDMSSLVASRITMARSNSKLLTIKLPITTSSTNSNGDLELNKDPQNGRVVINTGNLLAYDGGSYTLYANNTDIASSEITNVNSEKTLAYQGLSTTLDPARPGNLSGDLVGSLVSLTHVYKHNREVTSIGEKFKVDQEVGERNAYIVSCQDDLTIGINGECLFKHGTAEENSKVATAGIVIVDGNVEVQCDFWGIIIATGDITFKSDVTLRSTAVDLGSIIRNNTIVKPFFTENISDHSKGSVEIGYKDWKKD